jgi:hypothetical protein
MQWRSSSRSMAIGGACIMFALATSVSIEPANAQAMQQVNGPPATASQSNDSRASGFNALDPQWAFANPFMASRFGLGPMATGVSQQAYATKFDSGTVGLFVESNAPSSSNYFGGLAVGQQEWFSGLGDPAWRTSMFGSYKSDPKAGMFDGLYTTASFGVTNFKTNPSLPGMNFADSNDLTAVTASVGAGLQLTKSLENALGQRAIIIVKMVAAGYANDFRLSCEQRACGVVFVGAVETLNHRRVDRHERWSGWQRVLVRGCAKPAGDSDFEIGRRGESQE